LIDLLKRNYILNQINGLSKDHKLSWSDIAHVEPALIVVQKRSALQPFVPVQLSLYAYLKHLCGFQ